MRDNYHISRYREKEEAIQQVTNYSILCCLYTYLLVYVKVQHYIIGTFTEFVMLYKASFARCYCP